MSGILRLPRQMPRNHREWEEFLRDINRLITRDKTNHYRVDSTFARASDQRFIPVVNAGGKLSTQSTQPLTASTDSGGFSQISVAAHDVQYGFGEVSYNSGTISGLSPSTTYYVYADDPDYEGGAVTYLATTNANLITASDGRYYVGRITTPATQSDPPASGNWGGGGGGGGFQIP